MQIPETIWTIWYPFDLWTNVLGIIAFLLVIALMVLFLMQAKKQGWWPFSS